MLPEAHLWTRGMIQAMKDSEALSLPKLQEPVALRSGRVDNEAAAVSLGPLISIALLYVYALRHGKVKVCDVRAPTLEVSSSSRLL